MEKEINHTDNIQKLIEIIKKHGMNNNTYDKIALMFTESKYLDTNIDLCVKLLGEFVHYKDKILYVNEIKNFLKLHNIELFNSYGHKFENIAGCKNVFGFEMDNAENFKLPNSENDEIDDIKEKKNKKYSKPKRLKIVKRIKSEAKMAAIEQFHKNIEKRADKKKKRAEFDALIRKENGF